MATTNPHVVIRTDGSTEIGLGHVVRCISLAHMLKDGFDIHFYAREMPNVLKKEITDKGWDITTIKQESDFFAVLTGKEIVVLDGYHFDSDFQKKVKATGSKLVCIDDLHNQYFYADTVINHAPGLDESVYKGLPYTKYLLGPKYALLRPEFLKENNSPKRKIKDKIENIFICFGGADIKNLSSKVLAWLPADSNYEVTVIVGSSFTGYKKLEKVISERKDLSVSVKSSLSAKEMREEMLKTDIGIVPASSILFEIIASRVPAISGYYVDNQYDIYQGFNNLDIFKGVEDFKQEKMVSALENIAGLNRLELIRNQQKVIDYKSSQRIFNVLIELAA